MTGTPAYRVLGPLAPDVAGPRPRALLARLALEPGRTVPRAALVDALWGEEPPADASGALQTVVSRLRRALPEAAAVSSQPDGYALAVAPDEVDAGLAERLARQGRALLGEGRAAEAAAVLDRACGLWRGEPLQGVTAPYVPAAAARLEAARADLVELAAAAALGAGRAADAAERLAGLLERDPLRESAVVLRMRALVVLGRQADALALAERTRALLADELGVDPGAELQEALLAVLRGERAAPEPAAPPAGPAAPAYLTSFLGRDGALAALARAVAEARLVTLLGPGGVGKTRLATEAGPALAAAAGSGDPPVLALLAPVRPDEELATAVVEALGPRRSMLPDVTAVPGTPGDRLVELLAGAPRVLVLDNCEHVVAAAARLVALLLARCPQLRVVTTSREPLGLLGERVVAVPPLDDAAAAELLRQRADAVRPGSADDDRLVAEVCRRLDRLPLAIELAAARLRGMTLQHVADRLDDRFRLLRGDDPALSTRHRGLRAVIDWSWELLPPADRRVLRRLAVFAGGASVPLAAAVCADDGGDAVEVADALARLAEQSLLEAGADGRYRMLETVREYARERLREAGEEEEVRLRHARAYLELVERVEPDLRTAGQSAAISLLRAERAEVGAAIEAFVAAGDVDGALRTGAGLCWYWVLLGSHAEAAVELARLHDLPGDASPSARALVESMWLLAAGTSTGVPDLAERFLAVQELVTSTPPDERHPLLALVGVVAGIVADDSAAVRAAAEEVLPGADTWQQAALHLVVALSDENAGEVEGQLEGLERALALFRRVGDGWGMAMTLSQLAGVHALRGELEQAEAAYREAVERLVGLQAVDDASFTRVRLAMLHAAHGDPAAARDALESAVAVSESTGSLASGALALMALAELDLVEGDPAAALRRLGPVRPSGPEPGSHEPAQLTALVLAVAASAEAALGAVDRARVAGLDALARASAVRDMPCLAEVVAVWADLALAAGDGGGAAYALGAAAAVRGADDLGGLRTRRLRDAALALVGEDGVSAAYAQGRALGRHEVLGALRASGALPVRPGGERDEDREQPDHPAGGDEQRLRDRAADEQPALGLEDVADGVQVGPGL
ncbi:putative ATPase [Motilibacter rhizosphaerae]|uniref:Putative ATPase n=1 Tax=Motilibacter rhizosphaerae TaxID=598652 RepID=A0A4Q7NSL9_9ACTN|nr:putative ATPase [Motilibacter rhizosphaerae]